MRRLPYIPAPFLICMLCVSFVSFVLLACGLDVPGGEFPPTTPTPRGPTPTPVIMGAPKLKETNTPVPPPPTPTPRPALPTEGSVATPVQAAQPTAAGPADQATTAAITQTVPAATAEATAPAPAAAQPQTTDMAIIPAGPFTMGYAEGMDDEQPPHQVDVPEFQIDLFEVTNSQYAAFVEAMGYQTEAEQAGSSRSWRDDWGEGKDNHPVVRVSWNDAIAYCQWAGKRLPSEAEWEKAARGEQAFLYPWGNDYVAGRSNGRDTGIRGTVAVGSYGEGVSPYGLFDMAGNVREWTSDPGYLPYPGNSIPSTYYGEEFRVLRGGGWFDDPPDLRATRRNPTSPTAANRDIGFRCAQ